MRSELEVIGSDKGFGGDGDCGTDYLQPLVILDDCYVDDTSVESGWNWSSRSSRWSCRSDVSTCLRTWKIGGLEDFA